MMMATVIETCWWMNNKWSTPYICAFVGLVIRLKGKFPSVSPLPSCAEFMYYLSDILLTYRTNTWVVKKFLELSHIEVIVLPVKERGQRWQAYTMHYHWNKLELAEILLRAAVRHEVEVWCQFLLQCLKLNSGHLTSSAN